MRISIIGTKGIPNAYGGFEGFAQILSILLVSKGFNVTVFQPCTGELHLHSYKGVRRQRVWIPLFFPKNIRRVIYNLISLILVQRENPDAILCCGHSPSVFFPLLSKRTRRKIILNLDGLEWKRGKWGGVARSFLLLTERLAVRYSGVLVADSKAIQRYFYDNYKVCPVFIPYGATPHTSVARIDKLNHFGLRPYSYGLLVARIEPENQIDLAIGAFESADLMLVVVGSMTTKHGKQIVDRYKNSRNVLFLGSIFDEETLVSLRSYSKIYFHGHTVGGTNPSLLEAMADGCLIMAHGNPFNRETLSEGGFFFSSIDEAIRILESLWRLSEEERGRLRNLNWNRLRDHYSWTAVAESYIQLFEQVQRS